MRLAGWAMLALGIAALAVFAASRATRPGVRLLGVHAVATSQFVSFTVATEPIAGNGERWTFANGATAIIGPRSLWLPSRMSAALSTVSWAGTVHGVFVPWRFILPIAALLAVGGWWLARGRRPRHGACARCGYDLSGSASARCPECGMEIGGEPAQKPMV
jgi:hypothetical protein